MAYVFIEQPDGSLAPLANGTTIMARAEWEATKARVDAFYASTSDAEIETHNLLVEEQYRRERTERKQRSKQPKRRPGYIYLAHDTTANAYKIGYSKNPAKRVRDMNVSTISTIELIHYFPADEMTHAEAALHEAFSEDRISGEWFDLDQDQIDWIKSTTNYSEGQFWGRA